MSGKINSGDYTGKKVIYGENQMIDFTNSVGFDNYNIILNRGNL